MSAATDAAPPGDLRPLAEAILADCGSPPVLVLAAWHYLYGWKTAWLGALAVGAAREADR